MAVVPSHISSINRWLQHPIGLFLAGGLLPLTLAPFYWWVLAIPAMAMLFHALINSECTKYFFLRIWSFTFGQFAVGASWVYVSMHDFGGTPMWLAVPMVAVFAMLLALIPSLVFLCFRFFIQLNPLTFSAIWFLAEWVRSFILTGFPWLYIGDAHISTPLTGWAPIIGSYGIGFIINLLATTFYWALNKRQLIHYRGLMVVMFIAAAGLPLKMIEWTSSAGEITVSAVQGNIDQNEKWQRSNIFSTIELYEGLSGKLLNNSDVILWPETAITMKDEEYKRYREEFEQLARESNTTIVTGIPYEYPIGHVRMGEFHNSIIAFGSGNGLYHKQKLVPFGEYVPLASLIRGLIPFFDLPYYGFSPGDPGQPPLQAIIQTKTDTDDSDLVLIQPFICYEIAYPRLVSTRATESDLLVTVSNDAWFGDSLGPKQHMALAQMRALETQRFVLRATNTGITALVNERGEIIEKLSTNVEGSMTAIAERRHGSTPYMRIGHYPLVLLSAFIILYSFRRKSKGQ